MSYQLIVPECCLNLASWQEFFGFDKNGAEGWFGFDLDRNTLSLSVKQRTDSMVPSPGPARPVVLERDPGRIKTVQALTWVSCDYMGKRRAVETLPGPFSDFTSERS